MLLLARSSPVAPRRTFFVLVHLESKTEKFTKRTLLHVKIQILGIEKIIRVTLLIVTCAERFPQVWLAPSSCRRNSSSWLLPVLSVWLMLDFDLQQKLQQQLVVVASGYTPASSRSCSSSSLLPVLRCCLRLDSGLQQQPKSWEMTRGSSQANCRCAIIVFVVKVNVLDKGSSSNCNEWSKSLLLLHVKRGSGIFANPITSTRCSEKNN